MDDANFASLDTVLARVKRRTLREREEDESFFGASQPHFEDDNTLVEQEDPSMSLSEISDYASLEEWTVDI